MAALASVGDQEVKWILKGMIMLESADGLSADTSAASPRRHPYRRGSAISIGH